MVRSNKKIDSNTEIVLQNNLHSAFTHIKYGLELDENGSDDTVTYSDLRKISTGNGKKILRDMQLIIIDVYSEDEEIEVEDVVSALKLTSYYEKTAKAITNDKDEEFDTDDFYNFVKTADVKDVIELAKDDNLGRVVQGHVVEAFKNQDIDMNKTQQVLDSIGFKDTYEFTIDFQNQKMDKK